MTIQEILTEARHLLNSPCPKACIDTPALDAALLLSEVLHKTRAELIVHGNTPIMEQDSKKYSELLERRRSGECVAYILGRKEFRELEFTVNQNVLVPRPDTETLVEAAHEYIEEKSRSNLTLLDLCTGSGAVAVSLKNEHPFLCVSASDISVPALETARLNAMRLLNTSRDTIKFFQSDLFENIAGIFDLIVSNPPYVPSGDMTALAPELQREPEIALNGGNDGLELIGKIISRAPEYLGPEGILLLEAGPGQMPAIKILLKKNHFQKIRLHKDLAGRERVISAQVVSGM